MKVRIAVARQLILNSSLGFNESRGLGLAVSLG